MATTGHDGSDGTDDRTTGDHAAGGVMLDDDPDGTSSHDSPPDTTPPDDLDDENALAEAAQAAHTVALRLLTVRARSRAELGDRLGGRGFPPAVVSSALDRLQAAGLLDDEAFAAAFAASRAERGAAASVLKRDLRGRGVPADVAERAAAEASPPETEADRARELAEAWLRRRRGLPRPVAARRLAGHLTRRGYTPATVERVVRDLLPATADDPPADPDPDA